MLLLVFGGLVAFAALALATGASSLAELKDLLRRRRGGPAEAAPPA